MTDTTLEKATTPPDAPPAKSLNVVVAKEKRKFGIPSRASVRAFKKEKHAEGSLIDRMHNFFDHPRVHIALNALLIADVIIIFAELFLMTEFPKCVYIERDCLACCPLSGNDTAGDDQNAERLLAGGGGKGDDYSVCYDGYAATGTPACDDYKYENIYQIKTILFWITIGILSLFFIEGIVEMLTLGREYWKQTFLVLDFVVITISLLLELVFHYVISAKHDLEEIAALLVLIRLWRFVRIGHGVVEVASETTSMAYEPLFEYIQQCENELDKFKISKPHKSERVAVLMEGHKDHGHHGHDDHGDHQQ